MRKEKNVSPMNSRAIEKIYSSEVDPVITIPYGGDNFENPIESKNVLSWYSFVVELILVNP